MFLQTNPFYTYSILMDNEEKHSHPRLNIRLHNYHFYHQALGGEEEDSQKEEYAYICPEGNFQQLSNWLQRNDAESGSYLITGYRGSGKSSFVRKVIKELNEQNRREKKGEIIPVFVSLGQDNIQEIEVLRILARKLHDKLKGKCSKRLMTADIMKGWFGVSLLLALIFIILFFFDYQVGCELAVGVWLFSVFVYLVWCCIGRNKAVQAVWRLEGLCRRLNASVMKEHSWGIASQWQEWLKASWGGKYSEQLPPATLQEIEYELTEAMWKWKRKKNTGRLVFVFDELDKTDRTNPQETNKEQIPVYEKLSVRPDKRVSSHTRSQQVLEFIANLKFFLSNAPASFIFIGGRELYEAYQADMSDRDFTISSIFNGVLNINSFLLSDGQSNSCTLNTEQLVCHFLLPAGFKERVEQSSCRFRYDTTEKGLYSLKNYYAFRRFEQNDRYYYKNSNPSEESDDKRMERVLGEVMFLYHFVTYLSFISNGSPKKIILFFEKYVRTEKYLKEVKRISLPVFPQEPDGNGEAFYLSPGFHSVSKIHFIHFLTYPIMQNIINRSSLYGDKLLVSASFLVAHIFKLHNNGFSWRNIEQTPEILEVNKTPEIREYIGTLIDLMEHTYLSVIPCGLYHYKFPMRIVEEISYFSSVSEEVSALFNFSRGELRGIKNHYHELLKQPETIDERAVYARNSIHHALGDIYMLEENYSSAIREYELCVEGVGMGEQVRSGDLQFENYLVFMNRTFLKLGLAHEKRRTNTSAYVNYDAWINYLKQEHVREIIGRLLKNTRTMHLALLAKLYVLEKIDTTGIKREHIDSTISDFEFIFKNCSSFISADFYRKLGDILYYKNLYYDRGMLVMNYSAMTFYKEALMRLTINYNPHCLSLCRGAYKAKTFKKEKSVLLPSRKKDNHLYSLAMVCENLGHVSLANATTRPVLSEGNFITHIKNSLDLGEKEIPSAIRNTYNGYERSVLYYWTAATLYDDAGERGQATKCRKDMVYTLLIYFRNLQDRSKFPFRDFRELLEVVARQFLISIYRQYEHIHLSEDNALKWIEGLEMYQDIDLLSLSITPEVEEMIYLYYMALLEMHDSCQDENEKNEIYQKIVRFYKGPLMGDNYNPQTLVTMVQNSKLKMRFNMKLLERMLDIKEEPDWFGIDFVKINNYLKNDLDRWSARFLLEEENTNAGDLSIGEKLNVLEQLITNSLLCLTNILESIIPMRNTTLFNNLLKGEMYYCTLKINFLYKMLYCYYAWSMGGETACHDIREFVEYWRKVNNITAPTQLDTNGWHFAGRAVDLFRQVTRITRRNNPSNTYLPFLAENAIHYYKKADEIHSQGKPYQEMVCNLFLLDDDLNNDTLQFYLAQERLEMRTAKMKNRLKELKDKYKGLKYYDIERYIRPQ